jgi:ArpU family phage transcriptional regulator
VSFELPELDRKAIKAAIESTLEKYRLYKYFSFEEREASIVASSEVRYHGPTNVTTDQTGSIAVYNVDQRTYRKNFCERVEWAVSRLPKIEKQLIQERYLNSESEYITDFHVYNQILEKSQPTYIKLRWKAFYRLALILDEAIPKQ